jgi:hypothetical protein
MIKIITIDREYGSGAAEIAAVLAAQLGWKLWDELLTVEIARTLGCDGPAVEQRSNASTPGTTGFSRRSWGAASKAR